ncbi:hypothetical protein ACQP2K_30990 [Microbispora siamensis]
MRRGRRGPGRAATSRTRAPRRTSATGREAMGRQDSQPSALQMAATASV